MLGTLNAASFESFARHPRFAVLASWRLKTLQKPSRGYSRRYAGGTPCVSDITLWETATLYRLGRIRLDLPLRDFLERAVTPPLVARVGISPAIAAEVAALPKTFHRDPGDRVIVASARLLGATLLTQDRRIVEAGLVPTLN